MSPGRRRISICTQVLAAAGTADVLPLLLFLLAAQFLTRQRQLEEELRQAQKMEAIGQLAGGVAHNFNNLLTGILGNLSMAELELPPQSSLHQYIHPARQAAHRAPELVERLLGFSQRSRLQLQACDMNRVVREVHELLKHSLDPRIVIRRQLQEGLWTVSADPNQLQQVLTNLCVNAADPMPAGGPLTLSSRNVRLSAHEGRQWLDAREGEFVRVCVEDAGRGMSPEVQRHLFEPFFTTKPPQTLRRQGSGPDGPGRARWGRREATYLTNAGWTMKEGHDIGPPP